MSFPSISTAGLLTNPSDPEESSTRADAQDAAHRFNLKLVVMNASTEREIDAAFATFAQQQIGALVVASDPFLFSRREQIVSLAARYPMAAPISRVRRRWRSDELMAIMWWKLIDMPDSMLVVSLGAPSQATCRSNG